jgi:hypothetical protein
MQTILDFRFHVKLSLRWALAAVAGCGLLQHRSQGPDVEETTATGRGGLYRWKSCVRAVLRLSDGMPIINF